MLKYKLTDRNFRTYNDTLWGENVTHKTSGFGQLCGPGWLHYYHDPRLAVVLNNAHAVIYNPILWECEATGLHLDDYYLKGGCTELTTIKQIPLPIVSLEDRIKIAIHAGLRVSNETRWNDWATRWLSGNDRSYNSAYIAYQECGEQMGREIAYAAHSDNEYEAYIILSYLLTDHIPHCQDRINLQTILKQVFGE